MTIEQLTELFVKFLKREPLESDISSHINKNYDIFERELSRCEEFKKISKGEVVVTNSGPVTGKIAILLSGHIRKNNVANSIKKHFSKYDYDVFVHSWDNVGLKGRETNIDDTVQRDYVLKEIQTIPNIKKLQLDNNKHFVKTIPANDVEYFNFSSPEPFIKSQLYSVFRSHELMEEYQKETGQTYRLVIKLRFDTEISKATFDKFLFDEVNNHDIIFTSDLDCHHHESQGDNNSAAGCAVCNKMYYTYKLKEVHNFEHTNIICDFYAYGSEKSMKTYCSMYTEYDRICGEYAESNKKQYKKNPAYVFKCDNVYNIRDVESNCRCKIEGADNRKSHVHALFYYQPSTPERILQTLLRDYMCLKSLHMAAKTVR